ncbi:MAG: hypothetical protein KDC38_05130, partial [Planctomycetes bacterium]|nr:hypothetical protein [Planctomycetota bacterium]
MDALADDDAIAIEFLARLHADREIGGLRPLRDYLALFPGHEETLATEYFATIAPELPTPSAPSLDDSADLAPLVERLRLEPRYETVA